MFWVNFLSGFSVLSRPPALCIFIYCVCNTCMYRPKNIWEDDMSTLQVTTVFFYRMCCQIRWPPSVQRMTYTTRTTIYTTCTTGIPRALSLTYILTLPHSYHIQTTPNHSQPSCMPLLCCMTSHYMLWCGVSECFGYQQISTTNWQWLHAAQAHCATLCHRAQ